jgi:hypothetical protein
MLVVYKVDRLTRSLAEFAKLVELFEGHGVSFVSVTQQFNTTTSPMKPRTHKGSQRDCAVERGRSAAQALARLLCRRSRMGRTRCCAVSMMPATDCAVAAPMLYSVAWSMLCTARATAVTSELQFEKRMAKWLCGTADRHRAARGNTPHALRGR